MLRTTLSAARLGSKPIISPSHPPVLGVRPFSLSPIAPSITALNIPPWWPEGDTIAASSVTSSFEWKSDDSESPDSHRHIVFTTHATSEGDGWKCQVVVSEPAEGDDIVTEGLGQTYEEAKAE